MYFKSTLATLLMTCASLLNAQGLSQMAFSDVKAQASQFVQAGELTKALPILQELVKRVEGANDSSVPIDYPIFLIGSAHIQRFLENDQTSELTQALKWFDRLENDFPDSKHLKSSLLKRIDILRALKRTDEAIELMKSLLAGQRSTLNLNAQDQNKLLSDISKTLYRINRLSEGLPYFTQLLQSARTVEDRCFAAAAAFEANLAEKKMDATISLLPYLTGESEIRYQPRLNIALLKASDIFADQARLADTSILLNLINTTDLMIDHHEARISEKNTRIETYQAMRRSPQRISQLQQEVKQLEKTLKQLRTLPTLRNELLVRRARNFSKTQRPYESFWMFYDLFKENPNDPQTEFFHYATFSGAKKINKQTIILELGRSYREKYETGDFYSDITAGLIDTLEAMQAFPEMHAIIIDFLNTRPNDPFSSNFLALYAGHQLEAQAFTPLIEQCNQWLQRHTNPNFEDGLYFWSALAYFQQSDFELAVKNFSALIEQFPTSLYIEDTSLRKGICEFYLQDYKAAHTTLLAFTERFTESLALDQAYYFLGEIEAIAGDPTTAIAYFKQADAKTTSQLMHDSVAFRIGTVLEAQEKYPAMRDHFQAYVKRFGQKGRETEAYLQIGRAYELMDQPNAMLALYRDTIERFAGMPENMGVDALIESYAEKYESNLKRLTRTVAFLDQMIEDPSYRETMLTDRGALFEVFYYDTEIDSTLYNRLRNNKGFNLDLMEEVTPLLKMAPDYHSQLAKYPKQTPKEFFQSLKNRYLETGNFVAECRMLMGLFRLNEVVQPSQELTREKIASFTPRLLLYVADYTRNTRLSFAEAAWNTLIEKYPNDDAVIVARLRLADVSTEASNLEAALTHLDAIVETFPATPQLPAIILQQGSLLSQMGNGDAARQKYQYILKVAEWRGVAHARALIQTGDAYMAEAEYNKAHGFFERTFLGYSNFPEVAADAYLADAEVLIKLNDINSAKATLAEALTELKGSISDARLAEIQDKYTTL